MEKEKKNLSFLNSHGFAPHHVFYVSNRISTNRLWDVNV